MPLWTALFDVLLLLLAALLFGVLFERLRQSAIMGYLLAGLLLGPNAYNIISNGEQVEALAELGVALLLFSIGLEFSWSRLRSLGMTVLAGGVLQVVITLGAAFLIALPFGVGTGPALAIGGMVALSSTACVLRLLVDRAEMDSVHGRLALGILLIPDLAVVPLVLLVSILGRGDMGPAKIALELVTAAGLAVLLVVVFYLLFQYAVPVLLNSSQGMPEAHGSGLERFEDRLRQFPLLSLQAIGVIGGIGDLRQIELRLLAGVVQPDLPGRRDTAARDQRFRQPKAVQHVQRRRVKGAGAQIPADIRLSLKAQNLQP